MPALDTLRGDLRRTTRSARFVLLSAKILASWETALVLLPKARHEPLRTELKSKMGWGTLGVLGAQLSVEGKVPRDTRGRLIVANHRSGLDIAVMLALFDTSILSRADVADWPLLGRMATHAHTVYVDRADKNSGVKAIRTMRRALSSGASVCVFPEGTVVRGDEIGPFQAGAFVAARGLDVDVLPVGLAYEKGSEWTEPSFMAHLAGVASREGTKIHACIGEPFALTQKPELAAARARGEVSALALRARSRLGARS